MLESQKVEERRLRRALQRRGLTLTRSRARDPMAAGYGGYQIADAEGVIHGGQGYTLALSQIGEWLERTALSRGPAVTLADAEASLLVRRIRTAVTQGFQRFADDLARRPNSPLRLSPTCYQNFQAIMEATCLHFEDARHHPEYRVEMNRAIQRVLESRPPEPELPEKPRPKGWGKAPPRVRATHATTITASVQEEALRQVEARLLGV